MSKQSPDSSDPKSRRPSSGDSPRPKPNGPNAKDRESTFNRPRPWLFLAFVVLVVAIAYSLYDNANSVNIRTSDLRRLVEVTRLDSDGKLVVTPTESGEIIAGDLTAN